jgi:hypothetical protein
MTVFSHNYLAPTAIYAFLILSLAIICLIVFALRQKEHVKTIICLRSFSFLFEAGGSNGAALGPDKGPKINQPPVP